MEPMHINFTAIKWSKGLFIYDLCLNFYRVSINCDNKLAEKIFNNDEGFYQNYLYLIVFSNHFDVLKPFILFPPHPTHKILFD